MLFYFFMKFRFLFVFAIAPLLVGGSFAEADKTKAGAPTVKNAAQTYEEQVDSAPQLLAEVQEELNRPPETIDLSKESLLPIEAIRAGKSKVEADLAAAREQGEILYNRDAERTNRTMRLPDEIADVRAKLAEASDRNEGDKKQIGELKAKLEALEWEQKSYVATAALFNAKQELNRRKVKILEEKQRAWQAIFDAKHAEETEQARAKAEAAAALYSSIPAVASLAEGNAQIAKKRQDISKRAAKTEARLAVVLQLLKEVEEQRAAARDRITLLESAKLGIDTETGKLLRMQRSNLPQYADLTLDLQETIKASASAQINVMEVRKALAEMPVDLNKEAERIFQESNSGGLKVADIRLVLGQKQDSLRDLTTDYRLYIDALNNVSAAIRKLRIEQQLYSSYLDERLLWIPSAGRLVPDDISVERRALARFFSPAQLGKWLGNAGESLKNHPVSWIIFALVTIYLIGRRSRLFGILEKTAMQAQKRTTISVVPTFKSLVATVLLALPLGLFFVFLGVRIPEPAGISRALHICGLFFLLFGVFLRMTGKNGFLRHHVKMETFRVDLLFTHLRWYFGAIPVVLFFFLVLPQVGIGAQAGRLFFILLLLLQLTFLHFVFRPSANLVPASKWLRNLIWMIAVAIPVIFIVGLSLGYISSVNTLREQTMSSLGVILIGLLVVKILERWIILSRRRLALEIAHRKYQARMDEFRKKSVDDDGESPPSLEEIEAHAMDIVAVEAQTKKILKMGASVLIVFGILSIWASSLPALSFLDRIELWGGDTVTSVENGTSGSPSDAITGLIPTSDDASEVDVATETTTRGKVTTLQDLIIAALIVGLFLFAARNLPGLLELSLLRRLSLRPGGNYAITTILKYILVVIGFLISFRLIGMTWSSVQWLAAAITLGIGFGLQEIFANFVAGIILLFERPIRLGDIVTVGNDISGKVTKIEIRATTIQQFNQRELIVPNKEFITGSLINWTLSNNTQRFEIPVGIAYGSDTGKATKILNKLLAAHPKVLKDPEPQVLFSVFGSNTLDFTVRAYVGHLDDFVSTQSELHYQIESEFREAGIDIAIPQRDIFIRSLPESFTKLVAAKMNSEDDKK